MYHSGPSHHHPHHHPHPHHYPHQAHLHPYQPHHPEVYVITSPAPVPAPAPAPVVVVEAPPKKRKTGGCFVLCLFLITIILCMVLVPWPGTERHDVIPGSQRLDAFNGAFIRQVMMAGDRNTQVYLFTSRPSLSTYRLYSNFLALPSAPYQFTSLRLDLFGGSTVRITWAYLGTCQLLFMVLKGRSRYESFVKGGNPSAEYSRAFNEPYSLNMILDHTDEYYFIFDNNNGCYPTPATSELEVNALSYDTSMAALSCAADTCTLNLDYGQTSYLVLEPPTATLQGTPISISFFTEGNWYTYFALYGGLFFGLIFCSSCITKAQQKAQLEGEESQALLKPPSSSSPSLPSSLPHPHPSLSYMGPPSPIHHAHHVQLAEPLPFDPYETKASAPPLYPENPPPPYAPYSPYSPYPPQPGSPSSSSSSSSQPVMRYDPQTGLPL